ncbi:MAG: DinB family protein [Acidobacteriota bacterium]|nr:DinB family protein [Acidobacteriota bacterium]
MAIKDALLPEFDHEMGTTRRVLERVPDEKFGWKPHPKSMSMGDLAIHLADMAHWTDAIMNQTEFDVATAPPSDAAARPKTRAAMLDRFDAATRAARAILAAKTDAEYLANWTLKSKGQTVFSMPRAATLRSFVMNHNIHHRGQLSVYLRLNDIAVPSIYGPSADEGQM